MGLITQCPACTTLFKVVPDQLRVSDGWVRCGQCDEVFDANLHLQTAQPAGAALPHTLPEKIAEVAAEVAIEPTPKVDNTPAQVTNESFVEPFFEENPQTLTQHNALALDLPDVAFHPTFMRQQSEPESSRKNWRHASMVALGVVLGMTLMLQVLVQERDRLAATEPGIASFLSGMCSVLGCEISPLRQIDSLVIDSSSFIKVRADVYRLNFVLKNSASVDLAIPAVEMTLTNLQDQALVRYVAAASETGASPSKILAGGELNISLPLRVKMDGNSERVAGYRLLAFYP